MTTRRPPAVATWLLEHVADCDVSVVGDLSEEYRQRRSRWWYWREAVFITVASVYRSVRSHPGLLLRALVTIAVLNNGIVMLLLYNFPRELLRVIPGWIYMQFYVQPLVWNAAAFALGVPAAWLMARFHPQVRVATVLLMSTVVFVGQLASPEFHRLLGNMPEPRFIPALVINVGSMLVWVAAMFIGGVVLPVHRGSSKLRPSVGS
jgi:hypothetical protein